MEKDDDYLKEKYYLQWEREMDEKKIMQEILAEEAQDQTVKVINSPKIVLRKSTKHNSFDYARTIKYPRIITRKSTKTDIQHIISGVQEPSTGAS